MEDVRFEFLRINLAGGLLEIFAKVAYASLSTYHGANPGAGRLHGAFARQMMEKIERNRHHHN